MADAPDPARPRSLRDFVQDALRHVADTSPEEALSRLEAARRAPDPRGDPAREPWHFVDVREPDEFAEGHVPGARSSPRGFLEVRADLEHPKRDPWLARRDRPLVLYCGGGHRSALAALTLAQMGFSRVVSLAGGWTAWTRCGYPVESGGVASGGVASGGVER